MRKLLVLAAAAAFSFPTSSRAQVTLGARIGFAAAMGDVATNSPLKDGVKSQVPLQLDAMYRITPEIAVGLYFSYGFGQVGTDFKNSCDAAGISCSVNGKRLGFQATYTLTTVSPTFVPWLGAGIGYEWLTLEGSAGGVSASTDMKGVEFLNLQVGGDFKMGGQLWLGPYVQLSMGQYSEAAGQSISNKATHEWLGFGVRGKFDL